MIHRKSPDNRTHGRNEQPVPTTHPRDGGPEGEKLKLGVTFLNLNVYGLTTADQRQKDFFDYLLAIPRLLTAPSASRGSEKRHIIQDFEGIIRPGEMLLVLGRPGSGCSTFLKTLAGYANGLEVSELSRVDYGGSY